MFLGISFGKLPWWITRSLSLKNNKKIKSFKNHFVDQNLFDNYLRRIGDTGVKSKLKHSQNGREDCHSQNHWNARWSRHVWLSKKNSLEKFVELTGSDPICLFILSVSVQWCNVFWFVFKTNSAKSQQIFVLSRDFLTWWHQKQKFNLT